MLANYQETQTDLEVLLELNRNYVRAAETSDVNWFSAHLSAGFLNSSVDGSIIDRAEFLRRIARPYPGFNLRSVNPRIQFRDGLALIQSGFLYSKPDGTEGTGRYTDVWLRHERGWLCVAAHFNCF
jgi:Domain of unknown function (DUF4440)